jgi:hypothetical protein
MLSEPLKPVKWKDVSVLKRKFLYIYARSRDSAVGIASGYGLEDRGFVVQVQDVQTGSEAYTASYQMNIWSSSLGGKAAEA